jgi:hypothetical protein
MFTSTDESSVEVQEIRKSFPAEYVSGVSTVMDSYVVGCAVKVGEGVGHDIVLVPLTISHFLSQMTLIVEDAKTPVL